MVEEGGVLRPLADSENEPVRNNAHIDYEDIFYTIISGPDCELKDVLTRDYSTAIHERYIMWAEENLAGFPEEAREKVWDYFCHNLF